MKNKEIYFIAGARPNFMKIAPIIHAFTKWNTDNYNKLPPIMLRIVHTGQHYDKNMSDIFFQDLGIPDPDWNLGVGSGSHAQQTAQVMIEFEKILFENKPDLVVVVGDVNSTIACALVSKKLHIPVCHIEAGLRSFDERMPEEINRKLTDSISDLLFITEQAAHHNLINEGIGEDKIFFVGNVMIDSLFTNLETIKKKAFKPNNLINNFIENGNEYALLTLHRPSNVDSDDIFMKIWNSLLDISKNITIIFPAHPRTRSTIDRLKLSCESIIIIESLGYLEMLHALFFSKFVLTDSGGLQEETTALKIPCITLRENTERPSTIEIGTNSLVGTDPEKISAAANLIFKGEHKIGNIPPLWDGKSSHRIVKTITDFLQV